jgi:23S rRNA (adenine2503-C2)-methyltransferase
MNDMKLIDTVKSKVDKTVKYIFRMDDGLITEMAYIDNGSNKDIICVSSQTACAMGCKFCHTTDVIGKVKIRNITAEEIVRGIRVVCNEQNLHKNQRMLLISYMGCGEPLLNVDNILTSMDMLFAIYGKIRFAVATMIPATHWVKFFEFTNYIESKKLPVKVHLSLHSAIEETRQYLIPNALSIIPSLDALNFYRTMTGNSVEIHYSLIKDVNDTRKELEELWFYIGDYGFPVKFMPYNKKDSLSFEVGSFDMVKWTYAQAKYQYRNFDSEYEFYNPPGIDVGASCGQFLFEYYQKYNRV